MFDRTDSSTIGNILDAWPLSRQLGVVVVIGAVLFVLSFFFPDSELIGSLVIGTLRFLLLVALLVLLTWKAIKSGWQKLHGLPVEKESYIIQPEVDEQPAGLPARIGNMLFHPLPIAILFLALYTLSGFALHVMSCDEGIWTYIAMAWQKYHLLPYVGTVENKTPGIFYLFAASYKWFGINYWFPRVLGIVSTVAASFGIYAIGKRLQGRTTGLLAMLFFGFTCVCRRLDPPLISQTETFMVALSVLGAYLVVYTKDAPSRRAHLLAMFAAGCSLGLAINFKQIALLTVLGIFFLYLSLKPRFARRTKEIVRDSLLVVAGILLITVLFIIPLLKAHIPIAAYLHGAWLMLLDPGSSASSLRQRIFTGFRVFASPDILLYLPMLLALILLRDRIRHLGLPMAGVLAWYLADLLAANSSGTYYGHQLRQAVPPLALLTALAFQGLVRCQLTAEPFRGQHRLLAALAIFFIWWTLPLQYGSNLGANSIQQTGAWLREHTSESEYVYVFAVTESNPILAYSERRAPSKYFNQFFFSTDGVERTIKSDIERNPPTYIVLPASGYMGLQPIRLVPAWVLDFTRRYYRKEAEFLYIPSGEVKFEAKSGFYVYRRNAV